MNNWTNDMMNRLETAYQARYEKEKSMVYLNDAYQNLLILKLQYPLTDNAKLAEFETAFMEVRDLFINTLNDRYPENYAQVANKIQDLQALNAQLA